MGSRSKAPVGAEGGTPIGSGALRREAGVSLLEVMVTMAIASTLVFAALNRDAERGSNLSTGANAVAANLRLARATAIGRGIHVRVSGTSSSARYAMLRLQDGAWVEDRARDIELPAGVTLPSDSSWAVEFDSRGTAVTPGSQLELEMAERGVVRQKVVRVWPSGQVEVGP